MKPLIVAPPASYSPDYKTPPLAPKPPSERATSEPQARPRSLDVATCSLPVPLVEKTIRRLQQATRIAQSSGCYVSADDFDSLVCELRAEAGLTTARQPEENSKDEPRRP